MSYSIQVGDSGFEQLASNAGYADFAEWVESLDSRKYGQLVHLYDHGWCQDIPELEKQLDAAMKEDGPKKKSVIATVEGFQSALKERLPSAVVVTVTAGIGDGDELTGEKSIRDRLIKAGYADTEIVALIKESDNHKQPAEL